jgi:hypothetical protein
MKAASDEWATAYITAILSADPALHSELMPSAAWLEKRFRSGATRGCDGRTSRGSETTALALLALWRLGATVPEEVNAVLHGYRRRDGGGRASADSVAEHEHGPGATTTAVPAAVLLAQLAAGLLDSSVLSDSVKSLLCQQRTDGGWNGSGASDLMVTHRALQVLNTLIEQASSDQIHLSRSLVEAAVDAIQRSRSFISSMAVPDEPLLLGLWLSSWLAVGGSVYLPSVSRILQHLFSGQGEDGRWMAAPARRADAIRVSRSRLRSTSDLASEERQCCITTATVVGGLLAVRNAVTTVPSG